MSRAIDITENASLNEFGRVKSAPVRRQLSEPSANLHSVRESVPKRSSIKSAVDGVKKGTADFFCVVDNQDNFDKWTLRRKRLLNRKCGKLKECDVLGEVKLRDAEDVTDGRTISPQEEVDDDDEPVTKPDVLKMTWDGLAYVTTTLKQRLSSSRKKREDLPLQNVYTDLPAGKQEAANVELAESVDYSGSTVKSDQLKAFIASSGDEKVKKKVPTTTAVRDKIKEEAEVSIDGKQRRSIGMKFLPNLWRRKLRKGTTPEMKKIIEDLDDHRPFFTYWITTVQILVLCISLLVYGFGPIGFTRAQTKGLVLVTSLSLQQVDYLQPANLFIGPSAADLIHLGAKFSPCMRTDRLVFAEIIKEREAENETGCCIRNDESGCVQTSKNKCSTLLSQWVKWSSDKPGPPIRTQKDYITGNRVSGAVCGQDPKYCVEPASAYPYEWPDDITKWPICRKPVTGRIQAEDHMSCELIGRPCCIGIYGQCQITTRDHCDFVKGFFHDEATLCSQVSCMEDVCGMIPFYSRDSPNQFYRLWISLFLHAGLLHLPVTVLFQFYIMRDIEKMIGSLRIAIIYLISGIGGNLASSIFVPYRAEVGPSGSQFGLLACLIVEVLNSWQIIEHPKRSLIKLCAIAIALFILGLLPWVDNYAHIFGFIVGFLLSLALLPYVTIKPYQRQLKVTLIIASLVAILILFSLLLMLFYIFPVYDCPYCQYLNCIPFTEDWCADQGIAIKRVDIL